MLKKIRNIELNSGRVKIITLLLLLFYVNLSTFSVIHFHIHLLEEQTHSKTQHTVNISVPQFHKGLSEDGECPLCIFLTQFHNAFLKHDNTQIISISFIGTIQSKILNIFEPYNLHFDSRSPPSLLYS